MYRPLLIYKALINLNESQYQLSILYNNDILNWFYKPPVPEKRPLGLFSILKSGILKSYDNCLLPYSARMLPICPHFCEKDLQKLDTKLTLFYL